MLSILSVLTTLEEALIPDVLGTKGLDLISGVGCLHLKEMAATSPSGRGDKVRGLGKRWGDGWVVDTMQTDGRGA